MPSKVPVKVDPIPAEEKKKKEEEDAKSKKFGMKKGKEDEEDDISEEDQKLKDTLELLVEQVTATFKEKKDAGLQKNALGALKKEIRSSTSSMTSIPKPLKFLRPKYDMLKEFFKTMPAGENREFLADIISVLGMTMAVDGTFESLKYKLLGSGEKIGTWGHEYVRNLAGEVGKEYNARLEAEKDVKELVKIVDEIIPFNMTHSAEADACDLLMEVGMLDKIPSFLEKENYARVCRYLLSCADYIDDPEEEAKINKLCYDTYLKVDKLPSALLIAIKLQKQDMILKCFEQSEGLVTTQLGYIAGANAVPLGEFGEDDDDFLEVLGNVKRTGLFSVLARELDVKEPKKPEDIYKSHLSDSVSNRLQRQRPANVETARDNLAASFVNGFVNAGFSNDKLITPEGSEWIYKNKQHGKMSAAASLGLIYLWDVEQASEIDRYTYSNDPLIKAGALLAQGILCTGVKGEMDIAMALLSEHIEDKNSDVQIACILGLGIAYVGSEDESVLELLLPLVSSEQKFEVAAMACLALGMVFVGSGNEEVTSEILDLFMDLSESQCKDSAARFMCIGWALLYLCQGEACEGVLETIEALDKPIKKYLLLTIETCAHAGSGNVLTIQKLLKALGEHIEDDEKNMHQAVACLGLAIISVGEELGAEMMRRMLDHILQYGEVNIRRSVPLTLGLLSVSNPDMVIMDTLSKMSHDTDEVVSENAILALGLLGAGTNNSRIAGLLRQLSSFYNRDPNHLFLVRIAQGLLHMGKGLMTLSPMRGDGLLINKNALAGLLVVLHCSLDMKNTILGKRHYILYTLATAMHPRMLITVDEKQEPLMIKVRVGQAVDTAGKAGKPKTITGFQTHKTPVLLAHGERAELATDEYIALSSVLEGVVVVKKNPDYEAED